ncbi:MAG: hypothetical protein HC802_14140 [Caldilineaceae bacterium]|nr:hypothetical protein [Caldilineaceae bacterium]
MAHTSTPSLNPIPLDAKSRRWALRLVTVLMTIESILLAGLAIANILWLDWERELIAGVPSEVAISAVLLALIFVPLALAALLIIVGLVFGNRNSWTLSMLLQGTILLAALIMYWNGIRPSFLYLFMLYAILMAFYLNSSDVRMAFFAKPPAQPAPPRDY